MLTLSSDVSFSLSRPWSAILRCARLRLIITWLRFPHLLSWDFRRQRYILFIGLGRSTYYMRSWCDTLLRQLVPHFQIIKSATYPLYVIVVWNVLLGSGENTRTKIRFVWNWVCGAKADSNTFGVIYLVQLLVREALKWIIALLYNHICGYCTCGKSMLQTFSGSSLKLVFAIRLTVCTFRYLLYLKRS